MIDEDEMDWTQTASVLERMNYNQFQNWDLSNVRESDRSREKKIFAIAMKEFFENVLRYQRYFVTITLGIFFALFGWLKPLLKNPVTAVALVGFLISVLIFVVLTLRAMLGLSTL